MIITINTYLNRDDNFGDFIRRTYGEKVIHYAFFKAPKRKFQSKRVILSNLLVAFFKALRYPLRNRKCYCEGCHVSMMLIYRLFGAFYESSHLYVYNFYLHGLSKSRGVKVLLKYLLNTNRITIIVQTPLELQYYQQLSVKARLFFVPYCSNFMPQGGKGLIDGKYYFCGGYTNRDYALVNQLAERHPEIKFVIIASSLNRITNIAKNIILMKDVSNKDFETTLSNSQGVIIPLLENVGASGQMLAISAMRNKKPIVYTDISSINYYFDGDSGYPYKIGDIESLDNAFTTMISNPVEASKKGEQAFKKSMEFTTEKANMLKSQIMGF